jgi:nucleotide-binding universal stress UspA family protein
MQNSKILVPTDFTAVADCALQHAAKLAKLFNGEVILMHVVSSAKDINSAQAKLDKEVMKAKEDAGVNVSGIIRVGNIFDDIGKAAKTAGARLIIMGTHGVKGIQNITGGYALKVITNSEVPFIVVQKRAMRSGYDNIVLPLNLSQNTKQKLQLAAELAQYFDSKIHIITPSAKDTFLAQKLKANIGFAVKYLREHKIQSTTHVADGKGGSFAADVTNFASGINADLISIVNFEGGGSIGMFGSGYEQKIIANTSQIPVMCINPVATTRKGSVFS